MTTFERRSLRKVLTGGMLDSTFVQIGRLLVDDALTPEDSRLDEFWDFIYPELEDKEGFIESLRQ